MTKREQDLIEFMKDMNRISPIDIDLMLEEMNDRGLLNAKGKKFMNDFWELFIHVDVK